MASADDDAVEDMMVIATCSLISNDVYVKSAELWQIFYRKKRHTEWSWIHKPIPSALKLYKKDGQGMKNEPPKGCIRRFYTSILRGTGDDFFKYFAHYI